jgi:hypothetical protein
MHINSRLRDGCIGHNDIFFLMLRVVAFLMLSINFDFVVDVVAIDVVVVVRLGLVVNVSVFCISLSKYMFLGNDSTLITLSYFIESSGQIML